MSLGQVKNLYLGWAKLKGPMSPECQQLNRLFSQCVDGNRIKIPEHLKDCPEPKKPGPAFVLDVLHEAAKAAIETRAAKDRNFEDYSFDAMQLLLTRDHLAVSEFELIKLTMRWCEKNRADISDFAVYFDFNVLSDEEKAWALGRFPTTMAISSLVVNALLQSNILSSGDLHPFRLHYPGLRWKCVFDSATSRMDNFLEYTARMLELFHKKLIVLRIDERMALAIYVPNKIEKHKECQVDSAVRVFAFPQSQGSESTRYRVVPTKVNYRLFCDGSTFQLYEQRRANTWIFLTHGPNDDSSYRNMKSEGDRRRQKQNTVDSGVNAECRASVALNKISSDVQRHVGRVNRQPILGAVSSPAFCDTLK